MLTFILLDDGYYEEEGYYEGEEYYEGGDYYEGDGAEVAEQAPAEAAPVSVLTEALIPEKPENWNDMSKTQKKNHRRKYERQRERMAAEGVADEDFGPDTDPMNWTEKKREDKLMAVRARFPMADDTSTKSFKRAL